jgi:hypothetical protein
LPGEVQGFFDKVEAGIVEQGEVSEDGDGSFFDERDVGAGGLGGGEEGAVGVGEVEVFESRCCG